MNGDSGFDVSRVSFLSHGWGELGEHDYEDACQKCEIRILVSTEEIRTTILDEGGLSFHRAKTAQGMVLHSSVPRLGLRLGDRLEPSIDLLDVAKFADRPLPFVAVFWRATKSLENGKVADPVNRRCPLFSIRGASPQRLLRIDVLHTMHLGVLAQYIKKAFWSCIGKNVFDVVGPQKAVQEITIRLLHADLVIWYKANGVHPGDRLHQLTPKMLGQPEAKMLKTKAAENSHLLRYSIHLAGKYKDKFDEGDTFLKAGQILAELMDLMRSEPRIMSREKCRHLLNLAVQHVQLAEIASVELVPKHHLMIHLCFCTARHGNPRWYANFVCESQNRVVANAASTCHRRTWAKSLFLRMRLLPFVSENKYWA